MPVPKMMPDETPYTEGEWLLVCATMSEIAEYLERVGDDVAEMEARDAR